MGERSELELRRELAGGVSRSRELDIRRQLSGVTKEESVYESVPQSIRQGVEGLNKGIADLAAAPLDLSNWLMSGVEAATGLNVSTETAPSEWLVQKMNDAGVNAKTEGLIGRVGEEVGANVLPLAGFLKLANTTTKLAGKVTQYFEPMIEAVRRAPALSTLADLGLSTTAGAGAYLGKRTGGPTGEVVGQTIGGLGPGLAMIATMGVAKRFNQLFPVTQTAKEQKAAQQLRQAMGRKGTEAEIVYSSEPLPAYGQPTTGPLANDPGLTGQQRALARRSPEAIGRSQDIEAAQNQSLLEGLSPLGEGMPVKEKTVKFFEDRVRRAAQAADDHIGKALERARGKRVDPDETVDAISARASQQLDGALTKSRAEEKRLWGDIGVARYDVQRVKAAATTIITEHPKSAAPNDIHPVIYQLARKDQIDEIPTGLFDEYGQAMTREEVLTKSLWKDRESIEEILALRTRLGEALRLENAAGRYNRGRIIRQLMEQLFDGVIPVKAAGRGVLDRVDIARAYSKSLNDAFTRGPIGKVMGYEISGDVTTAPEKLLSNLLRPGIDGKLGLRALRAVGDPRFGNNNIEINQSVDQYVRADFAAATIDVEGNFNHAVGLKWIGSRPIMDDPALVGTKALMVDAAQAERLAQSVDITTRSRIKRITNQSIAAKYTTGEPPAQVAAALKSKNPTQSMRSLLNAARKDPTGQAAEGIKGSFYEVMLDRIAPDRTNALDQLGNAKLQPKLLRGFIRDYEGSIRETYGGTGLKLLKEVSRGANVNARLAQGVAAGGGSDTAQNVVTQIRAALGSLGSIIGAKLGFGTHALVAAGTGRRMTLALSNRIMGADPENVLLLLEDALYHPELARNLLLSTKTMSDKAVMSIWAYASINQMGHVGKTGVEAIAEGNQ